MKKILSAIMAAAIIASMFAGCGACTHQNTEVSNAVKATCIKVGYSGDTKCKDCGEIIKTGKETPITDHTVETTGEVKATCTESGKSGRSVCSVCNKVISEDKVVPALGHKEKVTGAVKATCQKEGYTGDKVCETCGVTLSKSKKIPKTDHSLETKNYVAATCKKTGYSGDKVCKTCSKTIEKGTETPKSHNVVTKNYIDATCTNEGYSGDKYCTKCNELISKGSVTAKTGHNNYVILNQKSATNTSSGYTGDKYCSDCGVLISKGKAIDKLQSSPTYPQGAYGTPNDFEMKVFNILNRYRSEAGVAPLKFGNFTYQCAKVRAKECNDVFSHTRPNGKRYDSVLADFGFDMSFHRTGENVARYFNDAETVMTKFMGSEVHRKNILDPRYEYVSIATYENPDRPGYYVVEQLFILE